MRIAGDDSLSDDENNALLEAALAIAGSFPSSSFYKEYVEGRHTEEEVRFYYPDGDVVLEGAVDLLIHSDDRIIVVDYKTDKVRCPLQHKAQIVKYAEAMEEIYGKKCLSAVLYARDWSRSTFWDKDGNEA